MQGGMGVDMRTRASRIMHHEAVFVRAIETVIDSHLPCLLEMHMATVGRSAVDGGGEGL